MNGIILRKPVPKARRAGAFAAVLGAMLCLALIAPAASFALTLSPASSTNLVGTTQILTATGATPGSPVNFAVTSGPNAAVSIPDAIADGSGTAVSSYVGANAGLDTVAACNDPDQDEFTNNFASCADEANGVTAPDDAVLSNNASITWIISLVVTPPGAFNLVGGSHTVTATVNGVARCKGGTNDGTLCSVDATCTGGGTCSDKSNLTVGFLVTGPNAQDTNVIKLTDANGKVTFTYPDLGGAGTDTIQACLDLDLDPGESTGECLSEVGSDPTDIGSNSVRKVWGAQAATLTPPVAFNLVGTTHTVQTTLTGVAKICSNGSNDFTQCTTDGDCTGGGTCSLAGYPVFLAVTGTCTGGTNGGAICVDNSNCNSNVCTGGPNLGDKGSSVTNSSGVATGQYTSNGVVGQDTLQSCVDADPADVGSLPDDTSFLQCLNDSSFENDIPSNTATKWWLRNFVTGGGGLKVGKTKTMQFSGVVAPRPGGGGIIGQWNEIVFLNGKNLHCHWKTFTALNFSGPPATSPPSTHNTATFTTGKTKCSDGNMYDETVTIVDNGEGRKAPRDTINVVSSSAILGTGGVKPISTGNFQVHDTKP